MRTVVIFFFFFFFLCRVSCSSSSIITIEWDPNYLLRGGGRRELLVDQDPFLSHIDARVNGRIPLEIDFFVQKSVTGKQLVLKLQGNQTHAALRPLSLPAPAGACVNGVVTSSCDYTVWMWIQDQCQTFNETLFPSYSNSLFCMQRFQFALAVDDKRAAIAPRPIEFLFTVPTTGESLAVNLTIGITYNPKSIQDVITTTVKDLFPYTLDVRLVGSRVALETYSEDDDAIANISTVVMGGEMCAVLDLVPSPSPSQQQTAMFNIDLMEAAMCTKHPDDNRTACNDYTNRQQFKPIFSQLQENCASRPGSCCPLATTCGYVDSDYAPHICYNGTVQTAERCYHPRRDLFHPTGSACPSAPVYNCSSGSGGTNTTVQFVQEGGLNASRFHPSWIEKKVCIAAGRTNGTFLDCTESAAGCADPVTGCVRNPMRSIFCWSHEVFTSFIISEPGLEPVTMDFLVNVTLYEPSLRDGGSGGRRLLQLPSSLEYSIAHARAVYTLEQAEVSRLTEEEEMRHRLHRLRRRRGGGDNDEGVAGFWVYMVAVPVVISFFMIWLKSI